MEALKLEIEKGPREGETLEFTSKSGLVIRIGRVARGNTFAIKEDGVSSKHLSIEWSSHGKWILKDLESSNGTVLNSTALVPLADYELRDGDVIKFGEVTVIRVRFLEIGGLDGNRREKGRGRGRNAGRGGIGNSEDSCKIEGGDVGRSNEVLDSIVRVGPVVQGRGRGRGRGRTRGKAASGLDGGIAEIVEGVIQKGEGVEGSKNDDVDGIEKKKDERSEDGAEISKNEVVDVTHKVGVASRSIRCSKNNEVSSNVEKTDCISKDELEILENVTVKGGAVSGRRTRGTMNDVVGESVGKAEPAMNLRRSGRSRAVNKKDNVGLISALEMIPEASRLANELNTRTRRGRKKKEDEMCLRMEENVHQNEEEVNEGEQVLRESMHNAAEEDGGRKKKEDEMGLRMEENVHENEEEVNAGEQVLRESMHNAAEEDGKRNKKEDKMGSQMEENVHENEEEVNEGEHVLRESMHNAAEEDGGLNIVKPEPQSNIDGMVSKGRLVDEIVQEGGDLACKLNFVHDIGAEVEDSLNQNDEEEPECDVVGNVSQEPTAGATVKEAETEIVADLNKMTLGEWFDHLERCLPNQIRAETEQIVQDMLKRSQQFHEFMLQKQKDNEYCP